MGIGQLVGGAFSIGASILKNPMVAQQFPKLRNSVGDVIELSFKKGATGAKQVFSHVAKQLKDPEIRAKIWDTFKGNFTGGKWNMLLGFGTDVLFAVPSAWDAASKDPNWLTKPFTFAGNLAKIAPGVVAGSMASAAVGTVIGDPLGMVAGLFAYSLASGAATSATDATLSALFPGKKEDETFQGYLDAMKKDEALQQAMAMQQQAEQATTQEGAYFNPSLNPAYADPRSLATMPPQAFNPQIAAGGYYPAA